ncbi:MAG: chorismate mutase [Rhodospirillales bacterium]
MSAEITLDALRQQIDDIDTQIHDLLIERTLVVEKVRTVKFGQKVKIRASREAEILYRLTSRHKGLFPKRELTNIWRQIIVATLSIEGPFSVAVFMPDDASGFWDLACVQYGSFTPMKGHKSARQVVEDVMTQKATVGIVPIPRSDDSDPWWRYLANNNPDTPKVIARLPFTGQSNTRGEPGLEALVICPVPHEPAGRDRTFIVVEFEQRVGLDQLQGSLSANDLPAVQGTSWHDGETPNLWLYLVEVDAFIAEDDPRLSRFQENFSTPVKHITQVGGYALPLTTDELAIAAKPSNEEP